MFVVFYDDSNESKAKVIENFKIIFIWFGSYPCLCQMPQHFIYNEHIKAKDLYNISVAATHETRLLNYE